MAGKTVDKKVLLMILDMDGAKGDHSKRGCGAGSALIRSISMRWRRTIRMRSSVRIGENVGLPAGQMGNSEVGHLNIGAGRVVYQDHENRAIADGSIAENRR